MSYLNSGNIKGMEDIRRREKIYPDDKAVFCYYQGVLSITNEFLIKKGIEQLKLH